MDDYNQDVNTSENYTVKTENDSELDRVYVYSSPKHNGVYELKNHSFEVNVNENDTFSEVNETMSTVDMRIEFVNGSDVCNLLSYTRSYASWHDGGRRRRPLARATSINLRPPLSYR